MLRTALSVISRFWERSPRPAPYLTARLELVADVLPHDVSDGHIMSMLDSGSYREVQDPDKPPAFINFIAQYTGSKAGLLTRIAAVEAAYLSIALPTSKKSAQKYRSYRKAAWKKLDVVEGKGLFIKLLFGLETADLVPASPILRRTLYLRVRTPALYLRACLSAIGPPLQGLNPSYLPNRKIPFVEVLRAQDASVTKALALKTSTETSYTCLGSTLLRALQAVVRVDPFGNIVTMQATSRLSLGYFNIDHIVPHSRGGPTDSDNLIAMSVGANNLKSHHLMAACVSVKVILALFRCHTKPKVKAMHTSKLQPHQLKP